MPSDEKPEPRTPFEIFAQLHDGEHPVNRIDRMVTARLNLGDLGERIAVKSDEVQDALADRADSANLWIQLEPMLNERSSAKCEGYFNLGYQYGISAGRAQALEELERRVNDPTLHRFAVRLRALVQNAELPGSSVASVLLETVWALILNRSQESPVSESESG